MSYHRWLGLRASSAIGGSFITSSQLSRTRASLRSTHNLYLGLNPTSRFSGVKVRDDDITSIENILIDIDPEGGGVLDPPTSDDRAALLDCVGPHAHRLLYSGRGWQLILPVAASPLLTPALRHAWRSATSAFFSSLPGRVDRACSDLSRVYRMPGTINFKTGNEATLRFSSDANPIIFNVFLDKWYAPIQRESIVEVRHPREWWKYIPAFPLTAQKFFTEEVLPGERNHVTFVASLALREAGLSKEAVSRIIHRYNAVKEHNLPNYEVVRIIHNAFNKPLGVSHAAV